MSEKRSKRMAVVVDLTQKELDQIVQRLGQQQDQFAGEQEKLQQLESYTKEYIESINGIRTTSVDKIQSQRSFIGRMHLACKQQTEMVSKLQEGCDATLQQWQLQSQKLKKIQELVSSYQEEEEKSLDKAEQNMIDDLVTQRIASARSNGL